MSAACESAQVLSVYSISQRAIWGVQMACIVVRSEVKACRTVEKCLKVSLDANGGGSVLVNWRGPVP